MKNTPESVDDNSINCPYLQVRLNNSIIRAYTDSGATISLISDVLLSEKLKSKLLPFKGRVTDANGNSVPILGEIPVSMRIPSQEIRESLLVFKKTSSIAHHILIGMNILKHAILDFVTKNICFTKIDNSNKWKVDKVHDFVTLELASNKINYHDDKSQKITRIAATAAEAKTAVAAITARTDIMVNAREVHNNEPKAALRRNKPPTASCSEATSASLSKDSEPARSQLSVVKTKQDIIEHPLEVQDSAIESVKLSNLPKINVQNEPVKFDVDSLSDNTFNVHLNRWLTIPSNTVILTTVEINKCIKNGSDILLLNNVIKKSVVVASALANVQDNKIKLQLANLADTEITLGVGTKLCDGQYFDNESVNIVSADNVISDNNRPLQPLTLKDINCDYAPAHSSVLKLANEFRNACWLPDEPLGKYKGEQLEINLKENVVVNRPPYRVPFAFQGQLNDVIQRMLKDGTISRSKSNYNSPLLIVKREGKEIRPCIDYRALNEIIEPVSYPLPKISDVLNTVGNSPYMSTLDLVSAYHQLEIRPDDRHKTAFTVGADKFHFNAVPFGLQSSPAFFARVINDVLYNVLGPQCLAYLDDIILFSKSESDHLQTIKTVLEALEEAGLKVKIQKCYFFSNEIKFLGYQLNKDGMSMNPEKVTAIKAMPMPFNKKTLQSFLGAVNYYRIFMPRFAEIAEPLYLLLRKNVKFKWTADQTNAVEALKKLLVNAPIVKLPNFELPFVIYTDASNVGIGAVLMQPYDKVLHPLAYVSKSLDSAQRNYSTTKKEALALVYAVEQFRHIILGFNIHVCTDHQPLLGALKRPTKDQCLQRWSMLIQEYKVKLHYIKGEKNIFADMLSRLPVDFDLDVTDLDAQFQEDLLDRNNHFCHSLQDYMPEIVTWTDQKLLKAQSKDEACQELIRQLTHGTDKSISNKYKISDDTLLNTKIIKDIIYIQRKVKRGNVTDQYLVPYIPDSLMPEAFKLIHSNATAGHNGSERTLKKFIKNFYNYQESKLIDTYCKTCELCIQAKQNPKPVPILKYPIPTTPFHTISSDMLGPLRETESRNKYILTIRDHTTRYTILFPLINKNTDQIIDALRNVIANFGPPHVLITDNAPEYVSDKLRYFLKNYNCKKIEIAPYHAASQGLSERINREVNKLLRIYTTQFAIHDWDKFLPVIQLCINNTFNSSIGETPFYSLFAHDPSTSSFVPPKFNYSEDELNQHMQRVSAIREYCRETLLAAQDKYTEYTNTGREPKDITVGQRVYAKVSKHRPTGKLDLPIAGPFEIISPKGNAWKLRELATNRTYIVHPDYILARNIAKLTKFPKPTLKNLPDNSDTDSSDPDEVTNEFSPQTNPDRITTPTPNITETQANSVPERRVQPHRVCKK